MRIHVFTPLPPLRTEIANHSEGVLGELARRCDVTAWTTQADPACAGLHPGQVRRYDPADLPLRDLNDADAVFYNFGNNAGFHRPILQAAAAVPGIAVLHDLNMQHFFAWFGLSRATEAAYVATMLRHHGTEAAADAARFVAREIGIDPLVDRYPLPLAAADRAVAIVGHYRTGLADLAGQTRLPAYYLPLSTQHLDVSPPLRVPAAAPYRLVVFGFISGNRRVGSLLRAMAALPDPGLFTLDIYGTLADSAGVSELLEELGLQRQVRVHGFVSAETLASALRGAHLAVNLRFPSMGEASASQLYIWACALPSLVTRTGWYADLPADAVGFVNPETEVEDLRAHLLAFHADQAPYLDAGRRGRAVAEAQHRPADYAEGLLRIAAEGGMQHRRRGALDAAATVSRTLTDLAGPDALRFAAPGFARAIAGLFGQAG